MGVIYSEMLEDAYGPYFQFGRPELHVFRPMASAFAPGPCRCFNKVRYPADTTAHTRNITHTVSPQYDDKGQRYLVVYTKLLRELWCDHGLYVPASTDQSFYPTKDSAKGKEIVSKQKLFLRSASIVKEWGRG